MNQLIIKGIEFESKYIPNKNFYFLGSFTYQVNENADGLKNYSLIPNSILRIGIGYMDSYLSAGLFNSYQSAFYSNTLYNDETTIVVNPESEAFINLSLNLTFKLKNIFNSASFPNLVAEVYCTNLLDQKYFIPSINPIINTKPGAAGRAFYFKLRYEM